MGDSEQFTINNLEDIYSRLLGGLIEQGWLVSSEGTSGAQLTKPKEMKTQTKVAMAIGAVLVLAWGIGVIIILIAAIDCWMTKPATHFLNRANPSVPEGVKKIPGFRIE